MEETTTGIVEDKSSSSVDPEGDISKLESIITAVSSTQREGVDEHANNANIPNEIVTLEKTISEMNADFGEQRAKFKKLFIEELELERNKRENVEAQIKLLQEELNDVKSQVTITEFTKDNEIEDIKQRGQQEIATLRKLYEESVHEIRTKYEMEIQRLRMLNSKLETDLHELRPQSVSTGSGTEVSPGAVFSAMTKSLARKLNSTMSTSNDSLHDLPPSSSDTISYEGNKAKAVATSNKYAQEDAEVLRSLVVQLEEERSALKDKVRHSDDQLAALQNAQASLVKGNDALTVFLEGQNVQGVLTQLDDKLRQTRSGLEAEKSSRADLEMYVALVNAQKTLLQEELEKVKLQLRELRQSHEDEKKNHEDLKETWKKANEQFVQTQDAYQSTIHRMKAVMTRQQLDQMKSTDLIISPVMSPEESNQPPVVTDPVTSTTTTEPVVPRPCEECEKHQITIEKLRSDLQKAAKLRNEMEEEWCRISQDLQTKLASLEEQVGTYEVVLQELNTSCQQSLHDMEKEVKKLGPDREKLQKKLESLQFENDNLRGKHVAHSEQLQREDISLPTDVMELHEMILRSKDELISVKVGREEIESELNFFKARVSTEEQEKKVIEESLNNIEESLNKDIKYLKNLLRARDEEIRSKDKLLMEYKTQASSSLSKEDQLSDVLKEREFLKKEASQLGDKINTLRKELSNSEELQKDLIALSKSLQVELERVRQAETEVRFQHPDDISNCGASSCKKPLSDKKEKRHCSHCGRIFCTDCVSHKVTRGTRDYNVCEFCHTVLDHDSPPYFSTEAPHSPD